jgi:hypothetical protein
MRTLELSQVLKLSQILENALQSLATGQAAAKS